MVANRRFWECAAITVAIVTLSCGGSSAPTAPPPGPPANGPAVGAGTVLSLRSAETDQPVAGAAILLSGQSTAGTFSRSFTSDQAGQFTLDRTVLLSPAPLLDVTAAGFVTRTTLLRQDETTLSLWPATSSTGLDEEFSSTAVYSSSACPAVNTGLSPLRRAATSVETVQVMFGTSIQDEAAQAAHQLAISRLNTAMAGALRYEFTTAPTSSVWFVVEVEPNHSTCAAGPEPLRAATELNSSNLAVIGGRLVYCSVNAARSATLILHELGHTLGLYHSSSTSDVMYCSSGRPAQFSSREHLAMRLARQRHPGNRWPDNDRLAAAPLGFGPSATQTIMCGDRGPR